PELLCLVRPVRLVVPACLPAEPALGDQAIRSETGLLELLLHDPARLLGLHARRGVDEDGVVVLRDGQSMLAELLGEILGVALAETQPVQQAAGALLVGQVDSDAPVVLCHSGEAYFRTAL